MSENNPFEGIHESVPEPKKKSKKKKSIEKEIKKTLEKTDDDSKERSQLIYQIQQYGNNKRFGDYLRSRGHKFDENYLKKMSLDDLKIKMEKNVIAVGKKNQCSAIDIMIKRGLQISEKIVSNKTPLLLDGMTDQLFENEAFLDNLEMIKLKYTMPFSDMPPEMNLMLSVVQTGMMIHHKNKYEMQILESSNNLNLEEEIDLSNINNEA